jgi:hypothetical protein
VRLTRGASVVSRGFGGSRGLGGQGEAMQLENHSMPPRYGCLIDNKFQINPLNALVAHLSAYSINANVPKLVSTVVVNLSTFFAVEEVYAHACGPLNT